MTTIQIGVVMGSSSDWETMQHAVQILQQFGIAFEAQVLSAHRMPDDMYRYAEAAAARGLRAIIAGAGGAAHLPGMIAAIAPLPVIGVPIKSSNSIDGWDSLLSIVQMPKGVPVATVAVNGALNAGILAAQIMSTGDTSIVAKIQAYKNGLADKVMQDTNL
jgi:5-(carboxyamino)imidazole ribonucleotide mutase